jgi:hypothetical protein
MFDLISHDQALRLVGNDAALKHLETTDTKADLMNGGKLWVCHEARMTGYVLEGTEEQIRTAFDHLGPK